MPYHMEFSQLTRNCIPRKTNKKFVWKWGLSSPNGNLIRQNLIKHRPCVPIHSEILPGKPQTFGFVINVWNIYIYYVYYYYYHYHYYYYYYYIYIYIATTITNHSNHSYSCTLWNCVLILLIYVDIYIYICWYHEERFDGSLGLFGLCMISPATLWFSTVFENAVPVNYVDISYHRSCSSYTPTSGGHCHD